MQDSVLIVDDDRIQRRVVAQTLKNRLYLEPIEAENGKDCLAVLDNEETGRVKLVVLDLDMPVMDGKTTLKKLNHQYPHLPVIVLTGTTDMNDAVDAMKDGAIDFLPKVQDAERLITSARNALKISLLSKEVSRLKRKEEKSFLFSDIIGHDGCLADIIKIGKKAASSEIPILITGETGSGKEVFAQAIHGESARAGKPFIAVNCGAIPENLIESTLFGHEKGSFTGAIAKSPGKFLEANGGTIFLDEVGELPLDAQVKLLRVLQQQEIEPVGASKPVPVNVRIISATNRDLARDIKNRLFREDLYFRLNILQMHLPPLRQRIDDIPSLAVHFMQLYSASTGAASKAFQLETLEKLQSYSWPGNVRELENAINRAMVLSEDDSLMPDDFDLQDETQTQSDYAALGQDMISPFDQDGNIKPLKDIEVDVLTIALKNCDQNVAKAAKTLGIAKSTFYRKLDGLIASKS